MFLSLFIVGFAAALIGALKRSRRGLLTSVYSLSSMVVILIVLDRIARQMSDAYDYGKLAFVGFDLMFAVGAAVAYFHSSHTMKAKPAVGTEVTHQ